MSKFFVECPACQRIHEAGTGLFAKRTIKCPCGRISDVRSRRMTTCACPSCGNKVIYDKARGLHAKCPVCKKPLVTEESLRRTFEMLCPSCSCSLHIDKNAAEYACPVCDARIDVQREYVLEQQRKRDKMLALSYKGESGTLIWKHPVTDFMTGTLLTVHEGQEAVFLRNGAALDSFIASAGGPYKLETGNLPLLTKAMGKTMDGVPFKAEVAFISLGVTPNIKWGMRNKVRVTDPQSNIPFDLGVHGMFNLKVNNARKLLIKLDASCDLLTVDDLFGLDDGTLRPLITGDVNKHLPRIVAENQIGVVDINQQIWRITDQLQAEFNRTLDAYGLEITELRVNILLPAENKDYQELLAQRSKRFIDPEKERIQAEADRARLDRLRQEAEAQGDIEIIRALKEAEIARIRAQGQADAYSAQAAAEAKEMQMKGYTYQDETARKTTLAAVENAGSSAPAASAVTGAITDAMQVGVQMGVLGDVMRMTREAMSPAAQPAPAAAAQPVADRWTCPQCHQSAIGNFCANCGSKRPAPQPAPQQPAADRWTCPQCHQDATGNFCMNCGASRPLPNWTCSCGNADIAGNFCPNCGTMRPKSGF